MYKIFTINARGKESLGSTTGPHDLNSNQRTFLTQKSQHIALGAIIAAFSFINLLWLHQDHSSMPRGDCYVYLTKLLQFVDGFSTYSQLGIWPLLDSLSPGGRPPLYQILTVPFVFLFGRSEDAALSVNFLFLTILMVSTYNIGRIAISGQAGLLAAFLVASYPPVAGLSRIYLPHFATPACVALSLWLLLALLHQRSAKGAWLFGASLGFGLLVHPSFAYTMAVPTAIFGVYMLLFQSHPTHPVDLRNTPGWLMAKLRDPFATHGLLPGAVIAAIFALPWWLTKGLELYDMMIRLTSPELAGFTGIPSRHTGFPLTPPSFWWYAQTTPGVISNILSFFLIVGLIYTTIRRRLSTSLLVITLISSYAILSRPKELHAWMYSATLLPIAACITAAWIAEVRQKWLSGILTAICIAVGVFNYSVVTWGIYSWNRPLAIALGSPLQDMLTCKNQFSLALCPAPARVEYWPFAEIAKIPLNDANCRQRQPCRLMVVSNQIGSRPHRFAHYLTKSRHSGALTITHAGTRVGGWQYDLGALFESEYLIYSDYDFPKKTYNGATAKFLQSPPATFAEAHQTVADFKYPNANAYLLKRIAPLTANEAATSIASLDLPGKYKTKKYLILSRLYAAEGRLDELVALRDEVARRSPSTKSRAAVSFALAGVYQTLGRHESAIAYYKEVQEIDPSHFWSRLKLAEVYADSGNVAGSVNELEKAISLAPAKSPPRHKALPRVRLAKIYQAQGETERARALYQQAMEIDPDNVAAQKALAKLGK